MRHIADVTVVLPTPLDDAATIKPMVLENLRAIKRRNLLSTTAIYRI
jgi:hypothetical protein